MRRSAVLLAFAALSGMLACSPLPAFAEVQAVASEARPDLRPLKDRAERRFQVMLVRRGLVLVPRLESARARTIEIADGSVLVDGTAVTGRELRDRLGDDADIVVQLSFLDAAARRALFAEIPVTPSPPAASSAPPPPPSPPSPDDSGFVEVTRSRHGGARVRIGGDVSVKADEAIGNDVVVILGSARIEGRVDGEVVAVGGSVYLGPKADVRGNVTSVGGGIERAPGARVGGEISEVAVSTPNFGPFIRVRPWREWSWFASPLGPTAELIGTLVRMGLVGLFAALLVAMVPGPVRRVADRVTYEPLRAGLVGLAAQVLFVPLLVLTVVILAVSIIGIPLLLLVPFGLVAVIVAFLLGFAGAGCALGQTISRRSDVSAQSLIAALVIGLAVIWGLTVVARFAGLAGLPVRFVIGAVLFVAFVIEYLAWTVGLGAVLLSRFGRRERRDATWPVPPPVAGYPPPAGPDMTL